MKYSREVSQKELCYIALTNKAVRIGNDVYEYESNLENKEKLIHILNIEVKRDNYGYYM